MGNTPLISESVLPADVPDLHPSVRRYLSRLGNADFILLPPFFARLLVNAACWFTSFLEPSRPLRRVYDERHSFGRLRIYLPLGAPPRFMSIMRLLGQWAGAKLSALVLMLPPPLRRVVASAALRVSKLRPPPPRRRYREGYSGGGAIG